MTIDEKRNILRDYCLRTPCSNCSLIIPDKWSVAASNRPCLTINASPENDINEALRIIGYNLDDVAEDDRNPVEKEVEEDLVNHPNHYTSGGIECLDAMADSMTALEFMGYLKGAIIKYVWRYRLKGKPVEDLKKARFYLDKLIEYAEKESASV